MRANLTNIYRRVFKKHAEESYEDKEAHFLSMLLPIGVVLILCAIIIVAFYYYGPKSKEEITQGEEEAAIIYDYRKLDGLAVESEQANSIPWAIMIENHWESRPPSGLSGASIVFEVPVEYGITRFMAIYDSAVEIDEIGPVRSARDYYLDWASEFGALYAHVGGSPKSLEEIPQANIHDLNQFFNGRYYWRSQDRSAPHNVYTNSELLQKAMRDKWINEAYDYGTWRFKEDRVLEKPGPTEIEVDYSTEEYYVRWEWTSGTNEYLRYNDGELHDDADGTQIRAKNIAVVQTEAYILDREGRLNLRTLGKGKAWVFRDGEVVEATWSKPTAQSRLKFYDVTGRDIEFNRGSTWVQIITNRWDLKWK
ncbi:MAG: DUF3048 domain-containing protein [Calditrichae bacterium]|nr:DUF3048 domain-containing protein [Calditrichia bacterium]NIW80493.1 DUF3048 domain-containing protein [Calditrichia bacterium]